MFGPINVHREGMTMVYRTSGLMQAEIVKGRLESAGIPVMLDYESLGRVIGITVNGLGEVRVLVPNERADEAKELLAPSADDEQVTGEE
jgi:hypothetical protein